MGYYIEIEKSTFNIPEENLDKALAAFKELNRTTPDSEKRGGSYEGGVKATSWFSWMPHDYDKYVTTAEEVLILLGFETHKDETTGAVHIDKYDSKIGQEELFLNAIAHLVDPNSQIFWKGEDGARWMWTPEGVYEAAITYTKV